MKTLKQKDMRRSGIPSMSAGYASPDFHIVFATCENGFCDSAGHSGFEMTDHNGEGFWEE